MFEGFLFGVDVMFYNVDRIWKIGDFYKNVNLFLTIVDFSG